MADGEVQVPADQNLQAAQAAAVLNKPPPPPPQNPEEPPAKSRGLFNFVVFCLNSVLLREHVLSSLPLLVHFHLVL